MRLIEQIQNSVQHFGFPPILIIGIITMMSFYIGRQMKYIKLPQLIGYMLFGVIKTQMGGEKTNNQPDHIPKDSDSISNCSSNWSISCCASEIIRS